MACYFLGVCTVSDFSAEDKASGVKLCTLVHWRPGQGMSYFTPKKLKVGRIGA